MTVRRSLVLAGLLIAAALAPSPAPAYFIAHSLAGFDPAGSPEMFRPAADGTRPGPGRPPLPVVIEFLPLPPEASDDFLSALERAVGHYNAIPGSALAVTTRRPDPGAAYDPSWMGRYYQEDGRNTIEFVTADWGTFWDPNVIARTIPHLDPGGRMLEADIFVNAEDYRWAVFPQEGSFQGLAGEKLEDVEAIVTHELGHVFGIGHSQYPWAAMNGLAGFANTQFRRLTADDREAVRFLYPLTPADLPAPSIWGVSEVYSGGLCGMDTLSLLSYTFYYTGYIIKSHPLPADTPYCLFGSGFAAAYFQGMDLALAGVARNTVTGAAYVGPNFVRANIASGDLLPPGTYDFTVTQVPGGSDRLPQGLLLNSGTNGIPLAVIQPPPGTQYEPGSWVGLDGSGSADPDGSALTYRWWVEESPVGAAGALSSLDQPVTAVYLPRPGMYAVRLTVNDGVLDSLADQVLLRAEYGVGGARGHDEDTSPFACNLRDHDEPTGASGGAWREALVSGLILFALPLVWAGLRRRP